MSSVRAATAIVIILALMFIVSLTGEVMIDDLIRPQSLFWYLFASALFTGLLSTLMVEKIDIRLTER